MKKVLKLFKIICCSSMMNEIIQSYSLPLGEAPLHVLLKIKIMCLNCDYSIYIQNMLCSLGKTIKTVSTTLIFN